MSIRAIVVASCMSLASLSFAREPDPAVVDWIKSSAIPLKSAEAGNGFDDMQPIKRIVGDARVVGLGEATHGTREHFQLKHRMLEFLVNEMGFTIFSIEASMPDCIAINDYVLHGKGDPEKAVAGQGFWTWSTEEVLDMVKWMRRYNEDPSHNVKLKFYGFDMQNEYSAANAVLAYLKRVDEPAEQKFRPKFDALFKSRFMLGEGTDEQIAQTKAAVADVSGYLEANRDAHVAKSTADDFAVSRRCCDVILQAIELGDEGRKRASSLGIMRDMELGMNIAAYAKELLQYVDDTKLDVPEGSRALLQALQNTPTFARHYTADATTAEHRQGWGNAAKAIMTAVTTRLGSMSNLGADHPSVEKAMRATELCRNVDDFMLILRESHAKPDQEPTIENVRDRCMAENVKWILDHEGPTAKVVVWAHNGHVMRINPETRQSSMTQGTYMKKLFGDDYVVFGFSYNQGSFQAIPTANIRDRGGLQEWTVGPAKAGSMDETFAAAGVPVFAMDVRTAPKDSAAHKWLKTAHPMRMAGAVFDPAQDGTSFYRPLAPAESFDAILFTDTTTRARPLATLPFASMNPNMGPGGKIRLGVQMRVDEKPGVVVTGVIKDSPAEVAGLKEQDRIVKINGKSFVGMNEFRATLNAVTENTPFEIEFVRGEETQKATIQPKPKT